MRMADQNGKGRLGFLVSVAIFGLVAWVGFKIIPVRITAYNFRDTLREECRMGAVRDSDAAVKKRILDAAEELEIPLSRQNVTVRRTKSKMIVAASYEQPVDLKFTTYVYRFRATEEAPLF